MRRFGPSGDQGLPAGTSILRTLQDVRSAFSGAPPNTLDISALLALYGSILSLCARAKRITKLITARAGDSTDSSAVRIADMSPAEVDQFSGFFEELINFGNRFNEVNLAAVDIYYPGLREDLLSVTGRDIDFSWVYTKKIAPKYGLKHDALPQVLVQILERYSGDWGPENVGDQLILGLRAPGAVESDGLFYRHRDTPDAVFVNRMFEISALLENCRSTIRDIVRENWQFRDLHDISPKSIRIEGGLQVAKTEYNITHSQVGAAGPNAHVHDLSLAQHQGTPTTSFDLTRLSGELDILKAELAKSATDRDHYAAIVAVSDAASEARAGKGPDALEKLKGVGKWTLEIASKIGVSVASEAIKHALGIGR